MRDVKSMAVIEGPDAIELCRQRVHKWVRAMKASTCEDSTNGWEEYDRKLNGIFTFVQESWPCS